MKKVFKSIVINSKSKRYFFTLLSVIIFCLSIWVFQLPPLETAGAITTLLAPYLAVETIKPSINVNTENKG